MSVRFLHAADLHLGSPLSGLAEASEEMARRLGRATEAAVERLVDAAIAEDVAFVVVAGDLFDREARSVRANQFLVDQFERLADTDIPTYIVHGNHDPLGRGAERLDWPEGVHVFGADAVTSVTYPDADDPAAEIVGRSYGRRHVGEHVVDAYEPDRPGVPSIGVLHTALDPEGRAYVPCDPADLAAQDIDYWALGHVHHPRMLEGAPGGYPGVLQPRHAGEPPVGGAFLVELEAGRDPTIEYLPTAGMVWWEEPVDIAALDTDESTSLANLTDLEEHLVARARELRDRDPATFVDHELPLADPAWVVEGIIARWTLHGRGTASELLAEADEGAEVLAERLRDRLAEDRPFVWTEAVRDRTAPPLPDLETLVEEDDVIRELVALADELRADADARADFREAAGGAWQYVDDPDREAVPADRIPLTDERLDRLIDAATEEAVTRLAGGR